MERERDDAGNPYQRFLDTRANYGKEFTRFRDIAPQVLAVLEKHVECYRHRDGQAQRKELGE